MEWRGDDYWHRDPYNQRYIDPDGNHTQEFHPKTIGKHKLSKQNLIYTNIRADPLLRLLPKTTHSSFFGPKFLRNNSRL